MSSIKTGKKGELLIKAALYTGIILFGLVFPHSFSDHEKLLHFSAHVGMSFLLASCMYVICSIRLQMSHRNSYVILFLTIFIIGSLYKYFEIRGERTWQHPANFGQLLVINGYYISMSENLAGALIAILVIRYVTNYQRSQRKKGNDPKSLSSAG